MENTNSTGEPNVERPVNQEGTSTENTAGERGNAENEERPSRTGQVSEYEGYRPRGYRSAGGNGRYGEGASRPYYRRDAQGDGENGRRPYYSRQDGNDGERRPYRRNDNNGERRPYYRNSDENGERRSYRRSDGEGNARPYYRRDAQGDGENGRRPYYSRQDGNDGERRPYRRNDGNGERRPYYRNSDENGERRPYRRYEDDGNSRPYYRRDVQGDGEYTRRPNYGRRTDDSYGERRPYRRDGNEERRPYYRRDDAQPSQDGMPAPQDLQQDTGNMYTPEDYGSHTPVQPDNGNMADAPRQKRKRIVRPAAAPHFRRVDADRSGNSYGRGDEAPRAPRRPAPKPKAKARKKIEVPEYPDVVFTEPLRLNKFIANTGLCSRREADEYIQAGRIAVNGQVITELGVKVNPTDTVSFDGKDLMPERKIYLLLNKPKGFVTSLEDEKDRKTVMDLVHYACRERIYPVGRLDRQTTGVLLFTNDGELALKLTHPSNHMRKIYQVQLDRAISEEDLKRLADGIDLDDGFIAPDAVAYANDEDPSQVGVEIHSGRNRIVRRMFESIGYTVKKLDRVYFAGLSKKGLKRGKWRFLSPQEVAFLKMMPSN